MQNDGFDRLRLFSRGRNRPVGRFIQSLTIRCRAVRERETGKYGGGDMQRKYFLALAVLEAFFVIATSSAQAGWGYHSESSKPGESMSSEPAGPQGTTGSSEQPEKSMESSGYQKEEAVETGRLPERGELESNEPATSEVGGTEFRREIDTGP
jgi:hypothetical protein